MGSENSILIIEDEIIIVEVLAAYLKKEGYQVEVAYSGSEGLAKWEITQPDLILLDLMLPDFSGEHICQTLRKKSDVPIIMLTAKEKEESILNGFSLGADDYVVKPFSPKQVMARVKAILQRGKRIMKPHMNLCQGKIQIQTDYRKVIREGETILFTPTEYKLFLAFVMQPRRVFTRDELLCIIEETTEKDVYPRIIDTHIKNIRSKVEEDSRSPKIIKTVHGLGYRLGEEVL